MRLPLPLRVETFSLKTFQWLKDTPNRALDQAYRAAITIEAIETDYFNGNKIGAGSAQNPSAIAYFKTKLNQLLRIARWRLAEFRLTSSVISDSDHSLHLGTAQAKKEIAVALDEANKDYDTQQLLNKLIVVDRVLMRYAEPVLANLKPTQTPLEVVSTNKKDEEISTNSATKTDSIFSKSGVLPRSILKTGQRLNRELKSDTEAEVLREFQLSRYRTKKSVRFLILLIAIPLFTQQVSKQFIFSPILNYFHNTSKIEISLNSQQEREAIEEVEFFEKQLRFEESIGKIPRLSPEAFEERVEEKIMEVAKVHNQDSTNALANIFSDLLSAGVFAWILMVSSESIQILKSFIDELVYGLSDSAKAFVIILFTDVFVGFHSTHGWEVLLEGISRHFGIPENRDSIYLFIATFPVALDAIFKYWIFRYLSRISPSAVATYRNMNE